jgi:hypothetical protein
MDPQGYNAGDEVAKVNARQTGKQTNKTGKQQAQQPNKETNI